AIEKHGMPDGWCNVLVHDDCYLAVTELAYAGFIALAWLPIFLLGFAVVTRAAAWRSWTAALPEQGPDERSDGSPSETFAAMRRWLIRRRRARRVLRISGLVIVVGATVGFAD